MKKKYPFKFLDSYEKSDKTIFFGRDEETNELYELVFQSSIILLYGASGTGKTSLINCGLAGKFQPHDWYPLMIRRGDNINDSLKKALTEAGGNFSDPIDDIDWNDEFNEVAYANNINLSPVGNAIKSIYQRSFRPIYLIFDQFEELFILGSIAEQELFIETIKDILRSHQPVKIIFSIREEYLGHLFDFEQAVPQLLQNKMRIEPMNLSKVKQVIVGATQVEGSIISLKEGEADEIAGGIFEKIRGPQKSLTIQLPFLQVFLDKFYREITGDSSRQMEVEFSVEALNEMGEIGDVLIDFLDEQVYEIAVKLRPKYPKINSEIVWNILSPLATLEGTKEPISKSDLYSRLSGLDHDMIDDTIESFINSRILRYNENSELYEISHDALAKPISEKRSVEEKTLLEIRRMVASQINVKKEAREYFTEKQIHFLEPYLDKIDFTHEEIQLINQSRKHIRKKKRRRILAIAGSFFIVFAAFLYMTNQWSVIKTQQIREQETYMQLSTTYDALIKEQEASAEKSKRLEEQTIALKKNDTALKLSLAESQRNLMAADIARRNLIAAEKRSDTVRNEMRRIAIKGKRTIDLFEEKQRFTSQYVYPEYRDWLNRYYFQQELDSLKKDISEYANKLRTLTPYRNSRSRLWGYKDSEGNIAIFPQFQEASEFKGDFARVKFPRKNNYFKIDKEGLLQDMVQDDVTFIWETSGLDKKKPDRMFVGGYKNAGGTTFEYNVCRGFWVEGKHIGRLEADDKCHLGWGGGERITEEYDILTMGSKSFEHRWVPQEEVSAFEGQGWTKFIGGWNDNSGDPLYIGQSQYEGQMMPGKIWERYSNNYVVFDGKEIEMKKYSYLMIKKKEN